MKKLFAFFAAVLLTASVFAQSPEKMSYQAVIRNSSDVLVTSTQIGMEINIRQGSPTGTVVYTETQTPTTNANGLVSIEIGGAGFSAINWGSDIYYIETKTAVVPPLTTYTITGVSQLLSVPYALHAKTAESISGGITETDPIFGASVASGIAGTDTTNWNNKLDSYTETDPIFGASVASGITATDTTNWNNKQEQLTAGTGISIVGNTISATGSSSHYVGELYGGGVVFWVDQTGNHGLICSMIDNSTGLIWTTAAYQSTTVPGGALSDWDGQANTTAIVAQAGAGTTYAAGLCDVYTNVDYGTGVYSDWYLPSRGELNDLWNNIKAVQKALDSDGNPATTAIEKTYYWSSSEYFSNYAWSFDFIYGYTSYANKGNTFYVRAVRAF